MPESSPPETSPAASADPASWRPALRDLEVHHVEDADQPGYLLRDPLGLFEGAVFVPEGLAPVVGRLDGRRSVADIERELHDEGVAVPDGLVLRLCRDFDEALLLQGDLFLTTLERTIDEFVGAGQAHPLRLPHHAGSHGYPAAPAACAATLDDLLGPLPTQPDLPPPRGLIAPHIDLGRGAEGYAAAYRHLARCEPADLYVVLGTAHAGSLATVIGLPHDWSTPVGTLRSDRDFVAAVHTARGPATRDELFLHRAEHSVEFQMLFLARLLAARGADARVAGFLCGRLPHRDGDPGHAAGVAHLLDTLRDAARAHGGRVCFVSGADLAHVGPQFGDPSPIDAPRLQRLENDDRRRLAPLLAGRPGEFHRRAMAGGNPDRLCSTTSMYLVGTLAGGPGQLLHYGQAPADDGSQCVSWCAASFPPTDPRRSD